MTAKSTKSKVDRNRPQKAETAQSEQAPSRPSTSYSSDAPLQDPKLDRFDRDPFARRIAETLTRRTDSASIVIAIYGAWGDGKTTVLNFIRGHLEKERSVVCVNFNPWRLEGEDALLTGFFSTLAEALDAELKSPAEKVGDLLKRYSFLLKPMPGVKELDSVASGIGSIMSSVSIDKLRSQISSILRASKKRVVIMLDDIDRLDKTEIQTIFRLIKLTADFDYVAYLLAFDEEMVAAALGERYSSDSAQHRIAGAQFLEKIVQVGLHLPPAGGQELLEFAFEQMNEALRIARIELPEEDAIELYRNFVVGLAPRLRTPRMAKRYGNVLQFALGILHGEVRPADTMMIEGVRTFYPQLYLAIRDNKELLLKRQREDKFDIHEFIRKNTPSLSQEEEAGLIDLLRSLFPRTNTSIYGYDWEKQWSQKKRICSADYFDRYFSYAIRANDVSDRALDELLNSTGLSDRDYLAVFQSLVTTSNAGTFISKLRGREDKLSSASAQKVSVAISSRSGSLPSASGLAGIALPFTQAAVFVSNAIKCVPQIERLEVAERIIGACELPTFIAECMRWMSVKVDNEPRILEEHEEKEMRSFGAKSILGFLEELDAPIFVVAAEDTGSLIHAIQWGLGNEKARDYVGRWLYEKPSSAIALIRAYKGKGTSLETGLPVEGHFFRQQYDAIAALVDPDRLVDALASVYGEVLTASADDLSESDGGLGLAKEFISMHRNIAEQRQVNPPPQE